MSGIADCRETRSPCSARSTGVCPHPFPLMRSVAISRPGAVAQLASLRFLGVDMRPILVPPPVDRNVDSPGSLKDWLAENRQPILDRLDEGGALLFRGWTINGVPDFEAAADANFGRL